MLYSVNADSSNADIKGTVLGRQFHLQVLTSSATTPLSYPLVQLTLARDPVYGMKTITYRLRNDLGAPAVASVTVGAAVLDYPVTAGLWTDFSPSLLADIRACWPSLIAEDHSMSVFLLGGAGCRATPLNASFSYLHLDPDPSYDAAASLDAIIAAARAPYPGLLVPVGLEHSVDHHFGQIGGQRFFYPYPEADAATHSNFGDAVAFDQVAKILDNGGVSCYNHPFGTGTTLPTGAKRTALLNSTITAVLATRAYNADTIEVYGKRCMDLAGHLEVLDAASANLLFITAVGVSDDHTGQSWSTQLNRFATLPWMLGLDEASLQAALRGGRVAVAQLGSLDGSLDLSINNTTRMGQALVAPPSATDTLVLECFNPPAGSSLVVRSGPVDMRGASFRRSTVLTTVSSSALAAGAVAVPLDGATPVYYRAELLDSSGVTIALTNPVWRLTDPTAVPPNRLVLG